MKWRLHRDQPAPRNPATNTGGAAARTRAEAGLARQKAQQPEVTRVAESLRDLRERNHFAAQIRLIFLGGNLDERH